LSSDVFQRLVAWVARRPAAVVGAVVALAVAAALLAALALRPTAGTDTLVGRGSSTYQNTQRYHERFGDDAVIVLVRGPLTKLVLTADIERVLGLEGCLSGNLPAKINPRGGPNGPCAQIARTKPVQVVYGPGTFINEAVRQISDQFNAQVQRSAAQAKSASDAAYRLARGKGRSKAEARKIANQAQQLVNLQFTRDALQLGLRYGLTGVPRLNDPSFVAKLVFDATKTTGTPKPRFAYLFPTKNAALVQVRLKPNLSERQKEKAIALVRQAVAMPDWRLPHGGSYVVTGAPVVVSDLASRISHSLLVLLVAALLVMAATLALVFRVRLRLLPLGVALLATALTFGALAAIGAPLTMASIGVLPVLLGLAVDYAIQIQSRVREEQDVGRAAMLGVPTIATAGAATAAGFLVLALSPVPMVRQFGLLLVAGIVLALACALTAGVAVLVLAGRRPANAVSRLRVPGGLVAAGHGAEELLLGNAVARSVRRGAARAGRASLGAAVRDPRRVLAIAAVLAAAGWALDTQANVETDIQKLVPQDIPALRDLRSLQESTGVGGEIDVVVRSTDLTDPKVLTWMSGYQQRLLRRYGYSAKRGCGAATLCPAFSLTDLLNTQGQTPTQAQIRALLDAVPAYFSQAVVTGDRTTATLAFGIRLMPLSRQTDVIQAMRKELGSRPAGVRAELAGLPVLAADANAKVASPWRRFATLLLGLLAVALVLLAAFRDRRRALVPLVPIALATGWSALLLFTLRIDLNPMSVTLGALVIAISTEFSVLLAERYRQERIAGHAPGDALGRTYRSTGAAVLASGATAIAGFAVLAVSDIRMLRDFGWVTVVDLTVSLLGVLVVLPAVLVLAERGVTVPRLTLRRPRLRRPRLRLRRASA
jgi:hydrophobe/amphiphile efflux-3 (HAE3) family protein